MDIKRLVLCTLFVLPVTAAHAFDYDYYDSYSYPAYDYGRRPALQSTITPRNNYYLPSSPSAITGQAGLDYYSSTVSYSYHPWYYGDQQYIYLPSTGCESALVGDHVTYCMPQGRRQ